MPHPQPHTSGIQLEPLDTRPLSWPTANPRHLSADAQHLYQGGALGKPLDRDWFSEKTYRPQPGYAPTDRDLAAVKELVDGGLGYYNSPRHELHPVPVHAEYTVARGEGPYLAKVFVTESHRKTPKLLVTLVGAQLTHVGGVLPEIQLITRHATATDDEHDGSRTALLDILTPSTVEFAPSGQLTFHGTLVETRLYPLGTDLLALDDEGQRRKDADEHPVLMCTMCDGTEPHQEPHPLAPYLPQPLTTLPRNLLARVELMPIRAYPIQD